MTINYYEYFKVQIHHRFFFFFSTLHIFVLYYIFKTSSKEYKLVKIIFKINSLLICKYPIIAAFINGNAGKVFF